MRHRDDKSKTVANKPNHIRNKHLNQKAEINKHISEN